MIKETEVRFLDINKKDIILTLRKLGAKDKKEVKLREIIFYDKKLLWRKESRFIRLRAIHKKIELTYKHHKMEKDGQNKIKDVIDISFDINDFEKAKAFVENLGLVAFREQEKLRHTFILDGVRFDIDTWPKTPAYLEIEGSSEKSLKIASKKLGLNWKDAFFDSAAAALSKYDIPILKLKKFTFNEIV